MDKTEPMAEFPVQTEILIPAVLIAVAVVIGTVIYFVSKLNFRNSESQGHEVVPQPMEGEGAGARAPPVPRARAARQRMMRQAVRQEVRQELDVEDDAEQLQEEFDYETGKTKKLGVKKVRKLEMKAERQAQREQEVAEREDRKRRQEVLDQQRQQEAEREELDQKQKEDEEAAKKAEQEKQEQEAYLLLKESFQVHEEGFEKVLSETESQNLLQEFIDYVKVKKVVLLEDLGMHFNMKTQDAIQRVQELQDQGFLTGVVDDRGKFIYISQEELEGVAKFMQQRGRVSITDLAEASNTLVFLNAENESAAPLQQPLQA